MPFVRIDRRGSIWLPGNYYDRETFAAGLQNSVLAGDQNRPTWASIYAESAPKPEAKLSELTGKFAAGEG